MNIKPFSIFWGITLSLLFFTALGCGGGGGGGGSDSGINPVGPTSVITDTTTSTGTQTNTGTTTDTQTSTDTSTSTGSDTSTDTGTGTGSSTDTGTGSSTGTGTGTGSSTGTGTGTGTGSSTGTGTGTDTSTVTWNNITNNPQSIALLKGNWVNHEEKQTINGINATRTWVNSLGHGIPAIQFTELYSDDEIIVKNQDETLSFTSSPLISNTTYFMEEQVALDATQKWTTSAAKPLTTYYSLRDGESSFDVYILTSYIDPDEKDPPEYSAFHYVVQHRVDGAGQAYLKLTPTELNAVANPETNEYYLILKKID
jgi:hypothetical protein